MKGWDSRFSPGLSLSRSENGKENSPKQVDSSRNVENSQPLRSQLYTKVIELFYDFELFY